MDTEKSRLCTGFSIFHGFRHSPGVLCMPCGWWGWGGGPLEALGILDESLNGQSGFWRLGSQFLDMTMTLEHETKGMEACSKRDTARRSWCGSEVWPRLGTQSQLGIQSVDLLCEQILLHALPCLVSRENWEWSVLRLCQMRILYTTTSSEKKVSKKMTDADQMWE